MLRMSTTRSGSDIPGHQPTLSIVVSASQHFTDTAPSGTAPNDYAVYSSKSFNYNLKTGQPITFDTLFKPDTPLQAIFSIVQQHKLEPGDVIPEEVGLDPSNYQNFSLDNNGLRFYSQSFKRGSVEVPLSAIIHLLA